MADSVVDALILTSWSGWQHASEVTKK
jgi:hypothetical protein